MFSLREDKGKERREGKRHRDKKYRLFGLRVKGCEGKENGGPDFLLGPHFSFLPIWKEMREKKGFVHE